MWQQWESTFSGASLVGAAPFLLPIYYLIERDIQWERTLPTKIIKARRMLLE